MGLEHGLLSRDDGNTKGALDSKDVSERFVLAMDGGGITEPFIERGPHAGTRERLASLDIFRGLTIAVMILVDDAGGLWPAINHSPWNGVTLADFVMPFFLFIVGVAAALTFKRVTDKKIATHKAAARSLKLFALGILLQGGYYHGTDDLGYGVDIRYLRWGGILQRIALAYLFVAICETWLSRKEFTSRRLFGIVGSYFWHWVVYFAVVVVYLALIYGLYVPDWTFRTRDAATNDVLKVTCGVRGDLGPACNAVGYVDRIVLGVNHLYRNPMYKRTKACSINSPDYGPLPPNAPAWCQAPFDPEGVLSSFSAIGSCVFGVHYGHVLVHFKGHKERVWQWATPSFMLIVAGTILHYWGMPLNKPLYSLSYVLFTAGAAGLVFVAFYILVDVYGWRKPTLLLEWMGMNSLLIFVFAACGVMVAAIQGFYWGSPEHNLVTVAEHVFGAALSSERVAKLVYVLFTILCWSAVAGVLWSKQILWKL